MTSALKLIIYGGVLCGLKCQIVAADASATVANIKASSATFEAVIDPPNATTVDESDADRSNDTDLDLSDIDDAGNQKQPEEQIAPFDEWTKAQLLKKEQEVAAHKNQASATNGGGAHSGGGVSSGSGGVSPDGVAGGASPPGRVGTSSGGSGGGEATPPLAGGGGAVVAPRASATIASSSSVSSPPASTHHGHAADQDAAASSDRNYAAKECGAKVILANPEAEFTSALVNEKEKDEYMRNPCSAQLQYFVAELCETIQPEKLQIGNYELFSGRVKTLRIGASERYPATEWTTLGEYQADDTRGLQTFLPQIRGVYAKFLKVELLSHYGNEHYCTLSVVRVFGKSMVDELEEHDRQMNPPPVATPTVVVTPAAAVAPTPSTTDSSRRAPDVVVANATAVTPGGDDAKDDGGRNSNVNLVGKVKNAVLNITKGVFDTASSLLGRRRNIQAVAVNATSCAIQRWQTFLTTVRLHRCQYCPSDRLTRRRVCSKFCHYLMPPRRTVKAKTHHLRRASALIDEQRRRPTTTTLPNIAMRPKKLKKPKPYRHRYLASTRRQHTDGQKMRATYDTRQHLLLMLHEMFKSSRKARLEYAGTQPTPSFPAAPVSVSSTPTPPVVVVGNTDHEPALPGPTTSQKESVFIRLNNRLKGLEQNISLSGQYLSELSRKYVSRMEEIQKQYNRTLRILNETQTRAEQSRATYKRETDALRLQIVTLNSTIDRLMADWRQRTAAAEAAAAAAAASDNSSLFEETVDQIENILDGDADYFLLACVAVSQMVLITLLLAYACCCVPLRTAAVQRLVADALERHADSKPVPGAPPDGPNAGGQPQQVTTAPRSTATTSEKRKRRKTKETGSGGGDSALGGSSTHSSVTHSEISSEVDLNMSSPKLSTASSTEAGHGRHRRCVNAVDAAGWTTTLADAIEQRRSTSFCHDLTPVKETDFCSASRPPQQQRGRQRNGVAETRVVSATAPPTQASVGAGGKSFGLSERPARSSGAPRPKSDIY